MKKKKFIFVILGIVLISLTFAGGYIFGFADGWNHAFWVDASGKGLLLVSELKLLRRGDTDTIIELKEGELDNQIFLHGMYLEKGKPYLVDLYFNYFSEYQWPTAEKEHRAFMYGIARYRKEYPMDQTLPEFTEEADVSTKKELEANYKNFIDKVKQTLKKYDSNSK